MLLTDECLPQPISFHSSRTAAAHPLPTTRITLPARATGVRKGKNAGREPNREGSETALLRGERSGGISSPHITTQSLPEATGIEGYRFHRCRDLGRQF